MYYFSTEKGVQEYVKMAEGYDGSELIRNFVNISRMNQQFLN
jgi:hypothetical protein